MIGLNDVFFTYFVNEHQQYMDLLGIKKGDIFNYYCWVEFIYMFKINYVCHICKALIVYVNLWPNCNRNEQGDSRYYTLSMWNYGRSSIRSEVTITLDSKLQQSEDLMWSDEEMKYVFILTSHDLSVKYRRYSMWRVVHYSILVVGRLQDSRKDNNLPSKWSEVITYSVLYLDDLVDVHTGMIKPLPKTLYAHFLQQTCKPCVWKHMAVTCYGHWRKNRWIMSLTR